MTSSRSRAGERWALALLLLLVGGALGAELLEAVLGVSSTTPDLARRSADAGFPHLLGTDELGRDLFSRLLHAGRVSLLVGGAAAVGSSLIGVVVGVSAAVGGRIVDAALMRVTDGLLALPVLPLLLLASAVDAGSPTSLTSAVSRVVVLLAVMSWMPIARLVRAQTMVTLGHDYVLAARALGASWPRLFWRHVLPLVWPVIIVQTTLDVGSHLMAESALSFLGLGVQAPAASWGQMMIGALDTLKTDPPAVLAPGACIVATVVSVQLLGDALRDRLRERQELF
jgi:peptide/nickel transport system permease protein